MRIKTVVGIDRNSPMSTIPKTTIKQPDVVNAATPERIQLSRRKGFNLQAHSKATNGLEAVNVARPSKWGNPFVVGKFGNRAECVHAFDLLANGYKTISRGDPKAQDRWHQHAKANIESLRGKNLACWCPLPKEGEPDMCHAAVLLEIANQ